MTDDRDLAFVREVLGRQRAALLALPGVTGVGLGQGEQPGRFAITVYVTATATGVPRVLEGIPVQSVVTGPIRPQTTPPRRKDGEDDEG